MREKEIWQTSKGGYCQLVARATVILQQLLLSCNSKATGRRIVSRSTLFFQQRQQLSCSKENCHLVVAAAILQQGQQSSCSKGGNCHFVARALSFCSKDNCHLRSIISVCAQIEGILSLSFLYFPFMFKRCESI